METNWVSWIEEYWDLLRLMKRCAHFWRKLPIKHRCQCFSLNSWRHCKFWRWIVIFNPHHSINFSWLELVVTSFVSLFYLGFKNFSSYLLSAFTKSGVSFVHLRTDLQLLLFMIALVVEIVQFFFKWPPLSSLYIHYYSSFVIVLIVFNIVFTVTLPAKKCSCSCFYSSVQ